MRKREGASSRRWTAPPPPGQRVRPCCATLGATVRGMYSTPEAGTRSPYVQYGGSGSYVSTQCATLLPEPREIVGLAGLLELR